MRLAVILAFATAAVALVAAWPSSSPSRKAPAPVAHRHAALARPKAIHPSKRPHSSSSRRTTAREAPPLEVLRGIAKRAHAHFTFFVSGVYLVDWTHHERYAPPRNPRGTSAIGFAPDQHGWPRCARRLRSVPRRARDRHALQRPLLRSGWRRNVDRRGLERGARSVRPAALQRPAAAVWAGEDRRSRTPCLEGNLDVLYPVLAKRGFRYDASRTALLGSWPVRRDGIWSFPLLELPFIGHTFRVVSMDYNFMATKTDESPSRIENETYPHALERLPCELLRKPCTTLVGEPLRDVGELGVRPRPYPLPAPRVSST